MATFSGAVNRLRVFSGMGEPPLEIVAYSSGPFFPFRLKQNKCCYGFPSATVFLSSVYFSSAPPLPPRAGGASTSPLSGLILIRPLLSTGREISQATTRGGGDS